MCNCRRLNWLRYVQESEWGDWRIVNVLLELLTGVAFREGPALPILLCFTDRPYCATDCEEAKALVWATCCSLPAAGNLFGTSMLYLRRRYLIAFDTAQRY